MASASSTKLRPLGDRVVIKPTPREEMTKSGILLPDTAKEKPQEGEIIAVGPGGRETAYPDLEAMTRALLGEALPVAALFDWLAGRPSPAAPGESAQATSPPSFRQLGWLVDLARFDEGLIVARREAPPAVSVRVKLDAALRQD